MATFTATNAGTGVQPHAGIGACMAWSSYSLTAALALNDVIQMIKVPLGAVILDGWLACTDLDTGGSPTIVLDVGDGDDTDRFIDGATIGQTAGHARFADQSSLLYEYTAADTIDVLVQAAPATGASSGTIKMAVCYTMAQK